jgi:hypothetical protein
VIVALAVAAYFLAKKYEPEVRTVVVNELNSHLAVPVEVDDINLSLLQRFPYASIRFSNVVIPEVINGQKQSDTLLYAKDLYLQMGLFDFLKEEYRITEAELANGFFNMAFYKNGTDNFRFWKGSDKEGGKASLNIENIEIRDFGYKLATADGLKLNLFVNQAATDGNFGSEQFKLDSESDIDIRLVENKGEKLYRNQRLKGDIVLAVNQSEEIYRFTGKNISVAGESFELDGSYTPRNSQKAWSLNLNTKNAQLEKLMALLPGDVRKRFENYGADGATDLSRVWRAF